MRWAASSRSSSCAARRPDQGCIGDANAAHDHHPRIGWGLIGAGGISDQLARALSYVPEARLVAVGSRDAAKAQAFIDQPRGDEAPREPVRAHGSYQALVDDPEVDVVYIGTPHPDHVDVDARWRWPPARRCCARSRSR